MRKRFVGVKMEEDVFQELHKLTHLESLRTGKSVTVSSLLREVTKDFLRRQREHGGRQTAGSAG